MGSDGIGMRHAVTVHQHGRPCVGQKSASEISEATTWGLLCRATSATRLNMEFMGRIKSFADSHAKRLARRQVKFGWISAAYL